MSGRTIQTERVGRRGTAAQPAGWRARGFTVTELLVVIAIITVVLSVAVPSLNAMLRDADETLADQSLKSAVLAARDAAVQGGGAADGAVVFLFDPGGAIRAVPAVKVGTVMDRRDPRLPLTATVPPGAPAGLRKPNSVEREVFAPAPGAEAMVFPDWWSVRGWAPAGTITGEWYDSIGYGGEGNAAGGAIGKTSGQWVFPETGFFPGEYHSSLASGNTDVSQVSTPRQSFMVRFEAGSGALKQGGEPALFIDPNPELDRGATMDELFPGVDANAREDLFAGQGWRRIDRMESAVDWARRMLAERNFVFDNAPNGLDDAQQKLAWIGNESYDTVLVRPVTRLALYDERRLAQSLGGRVSPQSRSIYQWPAATSGSTDRTDNIDPEYVKGFLGGDYDGNGSVEDAVNLSEMITRRISGDTSAPGEPFEVTPQDEPFARIFTVRSYTGELVEVVQ